MCLAVPALILSVDEASDDLQRRGRVDFGGVVREVSFACVPDARPGQYALVHVGMAISVIDEERAGQVLDTLRTWVRED